MKAVVAVVVALVAAQSSALPTFARRTFTSPEGITLRYGLAVPHDYAAASPRPLVLALHPGGGGTPFYGDQFLRSIFSPGLRELNAIMVAPDAPGPSWTEAETEQAVMSLLRSVTGEFAVDRRRMLVVGFSMGGRGTWFMSSRHADLFTGAIVMAGQSDEQVGDLAKIPTYVIHSRDDERVPFGQAAERVEALERMGRTISFDVLSGIGHYQMSEYGDALQRGARWVREQWNK